MKEFKINVKNGLYIGDLCYALPDEIYYGVWEAVGHFEDGAYKDPKSGLEFAMVGTAYGDGCYDSSIGFSFPVDAGIIGIADIKLCKAERRTDLGLYLYRPEGEVSICYDEGTITVKYDDTSITIWTGADEDDGEEDY